ncbi:phosphatase PAP2 family protein [Herbaspirillum sp.]|uniref:phosphatase PAP2 family protein n=1 Tax=Herbaspirillum sp. TaxID=1890675 RepID=UPI001B140AE9|nr:phosphatase PAP2 family protein [Herbaspirillum sp.]MBO9535894.1 phosphatase PAP2 family protein [Herbaspirillum sp.]
MWTFITFFGDSNFTLPGAALLFLWLVCNSRWQQALRWGWWFGLAMLLVAVSKILFMAWNIAPPLLNFTGISGHSASAAMLYLGMALLLSQEHGAGRRLFYLSLAALLVVAIAMSRLILGAHSMSEVIAGVGIGAFAVFLFNASLASPDPQPDTAPMKGKSLMAASLLLLLLLTDGRPAPTQTILEEIAQALSGQSRTYDRAVPLQEAAPAPEKQKRPV